MTEWVQHLGGIRWTSFLFHKQKCFCDSYKIQGQIQMKLGGVLPTCASGNRHTDHGSDYRTSGEVNLSQLFFLWLGKNLENTNLGRHTRSEEEFQKSCLLKGRFHWRKIELKIEVWHSGNKKLYHSCPIPKAALLVNITQQGPLPQGKRKTVFECPEIPVLWI